MSCPKCNSRVTVPAARSSPLLDSSLQLEQEAVDPFDVSHFEGLADFAGAATPPSLNPFPRVVSSMEPEEQANEVVIRRSAVYWQAVLILLIAAAAFGLGYWFGTVDASRDKADETATPAVVAPPQAE